MGFAPVVEDGKGNEVVLNQDKSTLKCGKDGPEVKLSAEEAAKLFEAQRQVNLAGDAKDASAPLVGACQEQSRGR